MQRIVVSVIIPVYNSSKTLRKNVESLLNQDFPKNLYEIILVDDGSTDGSLDVISDLIDKSPVNLKVVKLKAHKGCFSARNQGLKVSNGEFVAFIDSDMIAFPDWLRKLTEPFSKDPDGKLGGVCGKVVSDENQAIIPPLIKSAAEATGKDLSGARTGTGNICYRKVLLQSLGGFDERFDPMFRGDSDMGLRCVEKGFRIEFNESTVAYHPIVKVPLSKVPKTYFRYNKDVLLYVKHGAKIFPVLDGPMTRPILRCFSPLGLIVPVLAIFYALFPMTLFFTLVIWFPFFIMWGYRLASKNLRGKKIPLSLRVKASIAYPLALLTIYVARVYGSIKYRKLLL
jgi:glycosyltransferase involved in cell wall biosynthesis